MPHVYPGLVPTPVCVLVAFYVAWNHFWHSMQIEVHICCIHIHMLLPRANKVMNRNEKECSHRSDHAFHGSLKRKEAISRVQAQCVKNTFYWFNQQKRTEPSRGRTRAECWVLRHMTCRVVTCYAPQASNRARDDRQADTVTPLQTSCMRPCTATPLQFTSAS